MPSPPASQPAIERALAAAKAQGLTITGFTVSRDGTVEVRTGPVDRPAEDVQPLVPRKWGQR